MNNIVQHEFIVFAYDHYNPLGVIRSLGENGIKPIFIAVKHKVDLGIKSKYTKQFYLVQNVEEGYTFFNKFFAFSNIFYRMIS